VHNLHIFGRILSEPPRNASELLAMGVLGEFVGCSVYCKLNVLWERISVHFLFIQDYLFSMIASVSFFILGIIEAYYSTGVWANNCNDVGADGVIHNGSIHKKFYRLTFIDD
jgi:hypothetical protein